MDTSCTYAIGCLRGDVSELLRCFRRSPDFPLGGVENHLTQKVPDVAATAGQRERGLRVAHGGLLSLL